MAAASYFDCPLPGCCSTTGVCRGANHPQCTGISSEGQPFLDPATNQSYCHNQCPDRCDEFDEEGDPGCNQTCDAVDDAMSPDCDQLCDQGDSAEGPDCNGVCEPGETGPDCSGAICTVIDQAGKILLSGLFPIANTNFLVPQAALFAMAYAMQETSLGLQTVMGCARELMEE